MNDFEFIAAEKAQYPIGLLCKDVERLSTWLLRACAPATIEACDARRVARCEDRRDSHAEQSYLRQSACAR